MNGRANASTALTRPDHNEGMSFTMATRHLTPELRPAERDAGGLLTLIVLTLVFASIVTLMAALS
jgi:hypothetical protein